MTYETPRPIHGHRDIPEHPLDGPSPVHKTSDTADDRGAMLDDGLGLRYLEALRKGVMLSG